MRASDVISELSLGSEKKKISVSLTGDTRKAENFRF